MNITRYPEKFGNYRYKLRVEFTDQDDDRNGGNLVFVMHSPATVREECDLTDGSRTRRRLIKFARDSGYKAMTEVNLFAYRCGTKAEMLTAVRDQGISAVGPENDQVISEAVQQADKVVVAWGSGCRQSHVCPESRPSGRTVEGIRKTALLHWEEQRRLTNEPYTRKLHSSGMAVRRP